jgi:hypothetical protein
VVVALVAMAQVVGVVAVSDQGRRGWAAPKGPGRRGAIEAEAARQAQQRPEIRPGTNVVALTADGEWVPKVTTTGIVAGYDFPVVWARRLGAAEDEAVPWPAEDVRQAQEDDGG